MTTERQKGAGAALAGVGLGALGTWLLSKKASAAPPGIDPQLWEALLALIASVDAETQQLQALIALLSQQTPPGGISGYPVPNADRLTSFRVPLTVAMAPVRLDAIPIANDFSLVVKSWPFNPILGLILVGSSPAEVQNVDSSYALVPNEFRAIRIKQSDSIYVSATIVPAWVIVSTELRSG